MIDLVRPSVSLCMIVRNEARNLAACLEPIRPLVREIIVVDTGSTDGTQQIASQFGAHVIEFPWVEDFSAARNESLRHATGDYIFWLDADDRLDAANVAQLEQLFASLDGSREVYIFDVLCQSPKGLQNASLECQPRLFRANPRATWQYRVHEQVLPSLQRLGYDVHWSDIRIDHEGYRDIGLLHRKALRNVRLGRVDYAVAPEDPAVLYHLGKEFMQLGNPHDALAYLCKSLQYARPKDSWVARVYLEAVNVFSALGRKSEALELARKGLEHFSSCASLRLASAELMCELGCFAQAIPVLKELADAPPARSFHMGVPGQNIHSRARSLLGIAHFHRQQFDEAGVLFGQIAAEDPASTEAWTWLGFLHLALADGPGLAGDIERLLSLPGGEPLARCLEAEALKQRGLLSQALASAESAVGLAPSLPLARMLVAELLMTLEPRSQRLRKALQEVLRVSPGNVPAVEELARLDRPQSTPDYLMHTVTVGEDRCTI